MFSDDLEGESGEGGWEGVSCGKICVCIVMLIHTAVQRNQHKTVKQLSSNK